MTQRTNVKGRYPPVAEKEDEPYRHNLSLDHVLAHALPCPHSMHDNVKGKIAAQNQKEILEELLEGT